MHYNNIIIYKLLFYDQDKLVVCFIYYENIWFHWFHFNLSPSHLKFVPDTALGPRSTQTIKIHKCPENDNANRKDQ